MKLFDVLTETEIRSVRNSEEIRNCKIGDLTLNEFRLLRVSLSSFQCLLFNDDLDDSGARVARELFLRARLKLKGWYPDRKEVTNA